MDNNHQGKTKKYIIRVNASKKLANALIGKALDKNSSLTDLCVEVLSGFVGLSLAEGLPERKWGGKRLKKVR